MTTHKTIFERYVLFQVIGICLILLFGMGTIIDMGIAWLTGLSDPHAVIKGILESSQGMLLRQREILWETLVVGICSGILVLQSNRQYRFITAIIAFLLGAIVFPYRNLYTLLLLGGWYTCMVVDAKRVAWTRWIPMIGWHIPQINWTHRSVSFRCILMVGLSLVWHILFVWVDCLLSYEKIRAEMEGWPTELLDSRISVLAQQPGVRADWHGVYMAPNHAVVVAEETMRLMAFPLDGGDVISQAIGKRWGPERAAPLDIVYDDTEDIFWILGGVRNLHGWRLSDNGWSFVKTIPLPIGISYSYMRLTEEGCFVLCPIQVKRDIAPDLFLVHGHDAHSMNSWKETTVLHPHFLEKDKQISFPREIVLLPKTHELVIAPDFGTELLRINLDNQTIDTLLATPTVDGKMRWVEELDRLIVALPNRTELWVIDVVNKKVDWVIPTQPGVRALAIDIERGVLLNASVLTGQILVQDIHTGEIYDILGTVMPMVREIALDTNRGVAVLTTWAAVYKFSYIDKIPQK